MLIRYKRLSNKRFCILKDNIVLQGSIFSSHGFLVCCGIVILLLYKVLLDVMFEGFKGRWCVVVVRQNKDVSRCNSVVVVIHKVIGGLWMV